MRKALSASFLTVISATLALTLGTTSAFAAGKTWTVTPGGAVTGSAGKTTLTDTTSGLSVTCKSSTLNATLKSGSGLKGAGIGTVTTIDFNNCSADGITLSLSSGTVAWPLNAVSYNSTSGVTSGTITGIHLVVSSSECSFVIDGTSGTAHNGKVKITYTNASAKLKILAKGDNLHVYNVSGCLGAISNGDAGTITSNYTVSPKQTITQP